MVLVALVAALVVVTAGCVRNTPPPITAASGPEVASRAGMSAGAQVLWESDAEQDADFAAIAAAGARWLALDVDWNSIQGDGPLSFRWDRAMDRAVLRARSHGLTIIGIAAYSPPWARPANCPAGNTHCLPANPNDYGRFMAAAAQRYGSQSPVAGLRGSITHWQIWNEPNHQQYAQPKPSPDGYTAMLKSAYVSIKGADPTATVITGGTAPRLTRRTAPTTRPRPGSATSTHAARTDSSTRSVIIPTPSRRTRSRRTHGAPTRRWRCSTW